MQIGGLAASKSRRGRKRKMTDAEHGQPGTGAGNVVAADGNKSGEPSAQQQRKKWASKR